MKKLLVFLTMVALMMGIVAAATTKEVIVSAADRLVTLQVASDGGWDWTSTNYNAGSTTSSNIVGVTGLGLLDAYKVNPSATNYLTAAEKAGDYLIGHLFNDGVVDITVRVNGFDIVFLYKLGEVSNSKYTEAADKLLYNVLHEVNYFSVGGEYGGKCNGDACTAQELFDGVEHRRGSTNIGIILWDLFRWVEAAELGGKSEWASQLKDIMNNEWSDLNAYTGEYKVIGLSGLILATGKIEAVTDLKAKQSTNGSWDGWIQDTAYALMALDSVGETAAVTDAASYLVNNFGYSPSYDGWLDGGVEYPEVNSECIQALYDFLSTDGSQGATGNLEGFHWSISVTPATLEFGNISRGKNIIDEADNDPIKIDTDGSETLSDNVYVRVDIVGTDADSFYKPLLEFLEFGSSSWVKVIPDLPIQVIPEHGSKSYYARLHGDTSNLQAGPKSATIVYTAYGEPL